MSSSDLKEAADKAIDTTVTVCDDNVVVGPKVYKRTKNRPFEIQDSIYGQIELTPLEKTIIDTEIFQRLRQVKQLGQTVLVFPGATHDRFSHCIGSCHLAHVYLGHLKKNSHPEEYAIDAFQEQMIAIAMLCHDLGHFAFSHLYDSAVAEKKHLQLHEDRSCEYLKQIWVGRECIEIQRRIKFFTFVLCFELLKGIDFSKQRRNQKCDRYVCRPRARKYV
jgi:HD superfamily phosphohydrolase